MADITGGTTLIDPALIIQKAGVGSDQAVAEFGCGHAGHYVFPLARAVGKNGTLYAVDIQRTILKNIEQRARTAQAAHVLTVWSDLERYGATRIPQNSLDHVVIINTLFQTAHHLTVLREAYRLLRNGGRCTVVEWLPSGVPFGPPPARRVRPEDMEQKANEAGFRPFARFAAGPYHYCLIFEK